MFLTHGRCLRNEYTIILWGSDPDLFASLFWVSLVLNYMVVTLLTLLKRWEHVLEVGMANCSKPCESIGNGWPFSYPNPAFLLVITPQPVLVLSHGLLLFFPLFDHHQQTLSIDICKVVITEKHVVSLYY